MNPSSSQPLSGRVALITGASSGIGLVTARELARQGAHVFIACRTPERAQAAIDDIRTRSGNSTVESLSLDLGDFDSVRRCAREFLTRKLPLHLLINNAGQGGGRGLTASGFEMAFGVNHMGHFLFTKLLCEHMKASAPARIVTVASTMHYAVSTFPWDSLRQPTQTLTGVPEYNVSKLANVLFSAELGRRLAGTGVTSYAVHPGMVNTDVWRHVPWLLRPLVKAFTISAADGAKCSLHCATSPELAKQSGLYYERCAPQLPSQLGQDLALAAQLWDRSEVWLK